MRIIPGKRNLQILLENPKPKEKRERQREREREREYCIFPEFIHSEMATQFLKNPNAPFVV